MKTHETQTLNNPAEEKVIAAGENIKKFLERGEAELAEILKKRVRNLKSDIYVEIGTSTMSIFVGDKPKGMGDVVLYIERNNSRKYSRVTEVYVLGNRRNIESKEEMEGLRIASLFCDNYGLREFYRTALKYSDDLVYKYQQLDKLNDHTKE
jgi:hypothetical protein